jgi:F-type H+-transporting ATPase subunit b
MQFGKIEQEHSNMRRSLRFKMSTFLGLACLTLCVWQTQVRSDDTAASKSTENAAEETAHGKPGDLHGDSASHESSTPHEGEHGDSHGDEHAGGQKGPMEWATDLALWTLVTFIVFVVVLKVAAWKPLMSALESRETGIMNNVQGANKARAEAEKALADYQSKLQKAEDEVRQLLADARKAAENARAEMLAATQKEVAAVKDRAIAEIDQVRVQALEDLFGHMATSVTKATEQVIRRSLTPADQDRLVSEAVAQFAKR